MLANDMYRNPHSRAGLRQVLAELQVAAGSDFEQARPIPAALNHSEAFLDLEQERIFECEWICVGREDEVAAPGDYLTHQIAGVPLFIVRQPDHSIRAFVNACAHRRACLLTAETGSAKRFTCPYHAWTYDTAGELLRAPYMEMKAGFEADNHRLRSLPLAIWQGFVYVSLAQAPRKRLEQVLDPLHTNVVGRYDMACYRTVLREQMVWNANWKNLIENFTESYHVPIAHRKTFATHGKPLEHYICGEDSPHYCYHRAPQSDDSGPGAAHPNNTRLRDEWRRTMVDFCVFPGQLVTLMPDYLWYITVQPLGVDKLQATWGLALPPEVLADVEPEEFDTWLDQFRQYMETANEEDRALVEALHRGSASPLLPPGSYHPLERNLWQFTRYLAQICRA